MVKVAGILIHYKEEVLLFKRSNKVRYNGNWSVPGGHIEMNENAEQAAKRETFEETMIMISGPIDEIGIYDERFALFSKSLDSKVEPVIDEEHDHWGWFEINNLPSPLAPFVADGIGTIYERK